MKIKKIIIVVLVLLLCFAFVACGEDKCKIREFKIRDIVVIEKYDGHHWNRVTNRILYMKDGSIITYEFSYEGVCEDMKTTITHIDSEGNIILFDKK